MSFLYGTTHSATAEVLVHVNGTESFYLGGGFGGVLTQDRYSGKYEKWCDIYASTSFGYIGDVMVKYKAGLSTYVKNGKDVSYKPMAGISAMYGITKDFGIEAGFDTFNKATIGFVVLF